MCCSVLLSNFSLSPVCLCIYLSVPHSRSFSVCLSFTLSLFLSLSRPISLVFSRSISLSFAIFLSRHRFTRREYWRALNTKCIDTASFFSARALSFRKSPAKEPCIPRKSPMFSQKSPVYPSRCPLTPPKSSTYLSQRKDPASGFSNRNVFSICI